MSLRPLLWATVLGATLALASGCASVMPFIESATAARPTARVTGTRLANLSLTAVDLEFDIAIDNPMAVAVPIVNVDYDVKTNGESFVSGTSALEGSIPAGGEKTIALPVRVDLTGLVRTVSSIRPGQVIPYDAQLGLQIDVPALGPLRLPLTQQGELPIPAVPRVEVAGLDWSEVSPTRVGGDLTLEVTNTNSFPFQLAGLDYQLSLADRPVASGTGAEAVEIPADQSARLSIPVAFSPTEVGMAVFGMLSGARADYGLDGSLALETPFGPLELPFSSSGQAPQTR